MIIEEIFGCKSMIWNKNKMFWSLYKASSIFSNHFFDILIISNLHDFDEKKKGKNTLNYYISNVYYML